MLQILKNLFGGRSKPSLGAVLGSLIPASKEIAGRVITEGDLLHEHSFGMVAWNCDRLGPSGVDVDEDHGTPLEFPMMTSQDLYRCSCGREVVRAYRSLI